MCARSSSGLPGEHILLNGAIDGTFPAHHPDPTVPENLEQLHQAVAAERCDLGIAFDGDADRIGVDRRQGPHPVGRSAPGAAGARRAAAHPGATIIADVKASQVLFDEIAEAGGKPLMWKTGHALIKAKMAETGAPLAGEMSGHIFFADRWYGFDDALYAAVRLLDILARTEGAAGDDERRAAADGQHARRCASTATTRASSRWSRRSRRGCAGAAPSSDIDGVRVRTPDGWWLLRASNTQAVLVARAEASTRPGWSG